MTEILDWGTRILFFLIDLLTLGLVAGVFYVIGLAVVMMARNQAAKWMNIAYILLVLGAGIALLRWYPQAVITSVRAALMEARPEADLLRGELQLWLPTLPESAIAPVATLADPTAAPITADLLPTMTPWPTLADPLPQPTQAAGLPPVATPSPTMTPSPSPTATPSPCILHLHGTPWPCPPTPEIYRSGP